MNTTNSATASESYKRTWLIQFVVTLLVFTVGGCLVVDGEKYTLIEAFIGSALIAFTVAEVYGLFRYIIKKESFMLMTHLTAKVFSTTKSKNNIQNP